MKPCMLAFVSSVCCIAVSAAGFEKTRVYSADVFTDVPADAWYAAEVGSTYELGLMNGTGNALFEPEGNVTVAEAVTMASRAAAIYGDKTIPETAGENWYDVYVSFAASEGILPEGGFADYERPAMRHEVASLFYRALPTKAYAAVNDVLTIPDVSEKQPYHDDLLALYRAGIVMGSDAYGSFRPYDSITRAEAAAIINRVALPENRLRKALPKQSADDAYALLITSNFNGTKEGIASGWQLDNRGGYPRTSLEGGYAVLNDIDDTLGTRLVRDFNDVSTGLVDFEIKFTVTGDPNGVYGEFVDVSEQPFYRIGTADGVWTVNGVPTAVPAADGTYTLHILLDLDNASADTYLNGAPLAPVSLGTPVLHGFRIGTTGDSRAALSLAYAKANVNYAVCDDFTYATLGALPFGFTGEGAGVGGIGARLTIEPNGYAEKSFAPLCGIVVGETSFILPSEQGMTYSMNCGGVPVVSVTASPDGITANGSPLYVPVKNVWYRLRVEADTDTMTADIRLNGRSIGSVPFAVKAASVDGIRVTGTGSEAVDTDDYKVFRLVGHDDYVPAPVKAEDDYTVGINVCPLWRNGIHTGWSCISPYDDIVPVLGYYDEGVPETADWEIKYLAEHGVDFEAFCWFADQTSAPLKHPTQSEHLHDGYMNAKYAGDVKYSLIWEAVGGLRPKNMDAWKAYYVPYLIENYFKDPRYMTIGNKPVFAVFGADKLTAADCFGHASGVKEAMTYLEDEVKKLGFDGLIKLYCGEAGTTAAQMGFDGVYAYGWGYDGYRYTYNVERNLASTSFLYTVPTISVGFNNVAWAYTRRPIMSVSDFKKTAEWVRDAYFPTYSDNTDAWKKNFVMLSNWNEYGEGTYIMPSSGNGGFGYLDALRQVFAGKAPDGALDIVPSDAQKARIDRLYPQNLRLLRREGNYHTAGYDEYTTALKYSYAVERVTPEGVNGQVTDTGFTGVTTSNDAKVMLSFKPAPNLDEAKVVRFRAQIPAGETVQVFFTTVADQTPSADKCMTITSETDEMTDFYFDFSKNVKWTGTLTAFIRIDPSAKVGVPFTLETVEFLVPPPTNPTTMSVNGDTVILNLPYEYTSAGDTLISFDPSLALDFRLGAYYTWDKQNGVLTLYIGKHTLVYTVGSDSYTLDGGTKKLGFTLTATDGMPMLPMEKLCEDVGYAYSLSLDGTLQITTDAFALAEQTAKEKAARTDGAWEFASVGDTEDWISSNLSLIVTDGTMTAVSATASTDPSIILNKMIRLEASRYDRLEFRVRYKYEAAKPSAIHLYYITDTDTVYNEEKAIYCYLDSTDSHGEWETYTADLKGRGKWSGTVTHLRLDPFNAVGTMEFDYIRFLQDPDYAEIDYENAPFPLKGGDAEGLDTSPFSSTNGTVTLTRDPDDENNTCYLVMSRGGKAWVYFLQKVYFKAGKTYSIDYDVRLAALDNDTEPDGDMTSAICCNFQYKEPGGTDHIVGNVRPKAEDGWVHYHAEYTVKDDLTDHSGDRFAIYSNPYDELGVGFMVDNIVVTELE